MTFATKIQSLTGANSGVYGPSVSWAENYVIETNGSKVTRYGLLTGLEELAENQTWTATFGTGLTSDGSIMAPNIQILDKDTLLTVSTGVLSDFGSMFAGVMVGSQQYCVANGPGGAIGGTHTIMICEDVTQVFSEQWPAYAASGSSHSAYLCAGKQGNSTVYLCVTPNVSGSLQKVTIVEYICAPIPTKRTLVEYVPTDVDAGWTEVYFGGACIDQTDGNLLMFLAGQSGATTRNYLLKVSVTDGSTVWQVAAAGTSARVPYVMQCSSILHQRFGYVSTDGPATITIVDTTDGSTVSTQTTGLDGVALVQVSEAYNDTLGCTFGWYFFTDMGADSPEQLNSTPSSFDGLGVLYVAERFAPATTSRRFLAQSRPVRRGPHRTSAIVPITDDARITESGDIRITMEADIRIVLP